MTKMVLTLRYCFSLNLLDRGCHHSVFQHQSYSVRRVYPFLHQEERWNRKCNDGFHPRSVKHDSISLSLYIQSYCSFLYFYGNYLLEILLFFIKLFLCQFMQIEWGVLGFWGFGLFKILIFLISLITTNLSFSF